MIAFCLVHAASAAGQTEAPIPGAPASQPAPAPAAAVRQARAHFKRGEVLYRTGRFSEAARAYRRALELDMHPNHLFNIAQCHRQEGKLEQAIFHYRLYLSDWRKKFPATPSPWKAEAAGHIEALTRRQRQQQQQEQRRLRAGSCQARLDRQAARCECTGARPPPPGKARPWMRRAGWITVSVGGAALVAGLITGLMADARRDDLAERGAGISYREYLDISSEVRTLERAHLSTLIIGAVAVAAGGSFLLWEKLFGGPREQAGVAPRVMVGSAGLGVSAAGWF